MNVLAIYVMPHFLFQIDQPMRMPMPMLKLIQKSRKKNIR
jgi:hypothetical protein